jgi:hypothetical protein
VLLKESESGSLRESESALLQELGSLRESGSVLLKELGSLRESGSVLLKESASQGYRPRAMRRWKIKVDQIVACSFCGE